MSTEGNAVEVVEVAQPDIADTDAATGNPDVVDQDAEVVDEPVETSEEKIARLEREVHGRQKKIDKQTAKLSAEREEKRLYRERLEQIHNAQNPNQRQLSPEQALQERARMVEIETEAVVTIKGLMKQDPKFADNLKALAEDAGPMLDSRNLPTPLLQQILECDKPQKVVSHLLKNPEVAAELEGLSPTRLAKKLAIMESQLQSPKISKNPEPITPVGQRGKGTAKSVEDMSMDEYIAHRTAGPNKPRWFRG